MTATPAIRSGPYADIARRRDDAIVSAATRMIRRQMATPALLATDIDRLESTAQAEAARHAVTRSGPDAAGFAPADLTALRERVLREIPCEPAVVPLFDRAARVLETRYPSMSLDYTPSVGVQLRREEVAAVAETQARDVRRQVLLPSVIEEVWQSLKAGTFEGLPTIARIVEAQRQSRTREPLPPLTGEDMVRIGVFALVGVVTPPLLAEAMKTERRPTKVWETSPFSAAFHLPREMRALRAAAEVVGKAFDDAAAKMLPLARSRQAEDPAWGEAVEHLDDFLRTSRDLGLNEWSHHHDDVPVSNQLTIEGLVASGLNTELGRVQAFAEEALASGTTRDALPDVLRASYPTLQKQAAYVITSEKHEIPKELRYRTEAGRTEGSSRVVMEPGLEAEQNRLDAEETELVVLGCPMRTGHKKLGASSGERPMGAMLPGSTGVKTVLEWVLTLSQDAMKA